MNEYGRRVRDHWKTWLPDRYSRLEDPQEFFTSQGEQIAEQITTLCADLERMHAEELKGLDYLQRVGMLNNYRMQAVEVAMRDFLPEPEPTPDEQAELDRERREQEIHDRLRQYMDKDGMPLDPNHRLWAMLDDPTTSPRECSQACLQWEEQMRAQVERQIAAQESTTQD